MKKFYFFSFFVLNFIFTLGSNNNANIDISTRLNLINPSKIEIKKMSNEDVLNFKLDNSKEEQVKVYIKELNNIKSYNEKDISGKLVLNSKQNNLKGKVTVRVMYN
ncbi:hypothetical protein HMPREF0202_01001 [Cetobacterium somerae ATCC BAA-474]|uniref:Uncharacterized protein n=1 Tax=Cetobacterium somerae ATCC BAA-474 TaxID=1319815 RepID=U7VBX4_9FUSO|nr:hypothetical protein [Cetobacterium somerae]ERT69035.1 hypothetical protein HMPREF0202_01001 [Cetobacterium somerae ATCC BAA-474]